LNHVSRQNEQNTKRADTKPIAIAFVSEFEHVAAEIITHCFYSLPNVPTHFFGQGAQLFASFLADLTLFTALKSRACRNRAALRELSCADIR